MTSGGSSSKRWPIRREQHRHGARSRNRYQPAGADAGERTQRLVVGDPVDQHAGEPPATGSETRRHR